MRNKYGTNVNIGERYLFKRLTHNEDSSVSTETINLNKPKYRYGANYKY